MADPQLYNYIMLTIWRQPLHTSLQAPSGGFRLRNVVRDLARTASRTVI